MYKLKVTLAIMLYFLILIPWAIITLLIQEVRIIYSILVDVDYDVDEHQRNCENFTDEIVTGIGRFFGFE